VSHQAAEDRGPGERSREVREVRAELMHPHELEEALRARPVAFIPLGSLEFHSAHLPIGLDALTAHGVCVRAARRSGGIVLPPIYQGIGGGHTSYPWTIMMASGEELRRVLEGTLARLQELGFRAAVLFTGHFSDEQLALVDEVTRSWNADHAGLNVIGTGVNRCPVTAIRPDHAGVFETSLLYALHPDSVDIARLPDLEAHPSRDPDDNTVGLHRHDPTHPLWGVFGPDPRSFDPSAAAAVLEALVGWLDAGASQALLH
jgi:creatinine amidohydrolase